MGILASDKEHHIRQTMLYRSFRSAPFVARNAYTFYSNITPDSRISYWNIEPLAAKFCHIIKNLL